MAARTADIPVLPAGQAETISADTDALGRLINLPFKYWAHQCHAVSSMLMRSGVYGRCCVARGICKGVGAQHSWIVLGDDPYDEFAIVVDPTLWSYVQPQTGIFVGRNRQIHVPFGSGVFWEAGMPCAGGGEVIRLTPTAPLSNNASRFLAMLGPLDRRGWASVAHLPVEGWPSREILAAMCDTPGLRVLIPIDIRGMAARREPGYFWPDTVGEETDD